MIHRRFALIFGIVFLLVGIAGFIPGVTTPHTHPDVQMTPGLGLVLGLFPVNVLHNIVHLAFGVWGLVASRSDSGGSVYAKAVAIIYALLTVMGLLPFANLHTTFGLIPLYGHDVWLHAGLAVVAAYFGFFHHQRSSDGTRRMA
ncbi:MAG: DUF4383 domain-containing protein [Pseudomonadota bacterium]